MERFVLFIREPGAKDVVDIHMNKPAAHSALVDYVRTRAAIIDLPVSPDDDEAIRSYFEDTEGMYTIARVFPLANPSNDQ